MRFKAVVEFDPTDPQGGYSAYVLNLPGCVTTGETLQEVQRNLQEAIELYLESALEDSETISPLQYELLELDVALPRKEEVA